MRKIVIFLTALVLVPAALAAGAPRLRIATGAPLTVAGSGFHPRERVTVAVTGAALRHVRAGATGSFVVTYPDLKLDRCGGALVVRASGALGTVFSLKIPPRMCLPARAGGARS